MKKRYKEKTYRMIADELKSKANKLWEMFWIGGLTNPLDAIEQITYLIGLINRNALAT